jgi:prepilin-type N-terminal cleavage/methylation domain-containing protein
MKGFTLIELLVSMGIMLAITATIAFNQSHYTSDAELKNLANNLGLSLRQAQVYGISVKEVSAGSLNFDVGYGVVFDTTPSGSRDAYISFADRNNPTRDGIYDNNWSCPINPTSECLDKTALSQGNTVSSLCAIYANIEDCSPTRVDITFLRPETEARVIFNSDPSAMPDARGARIVLSSADGKTHSVSVYVTGQISIQ